METTEKRRFATKTEYKRISVRFYVMVHSFVDEVFDG